MNKRLFKIIDTPNGGLEDDNKGKYTGRGPLQAARKVFNRFYKNHDAIFRPSNPEGSTLIYKNTSDPPPNLGAGIQFTIQEITPGGKNKKYTYTGVRTRLDTPKVIITKQKTFTVNYNIEIKKYNINHFS